jgi:hypothetical protein
MSTSTTLLYVDKAAHVKPFLGIPSGNTSSDAVLDLLIPIACAKLNDVLNVTTLAKHAVTDERVDGGGSVIEVKDFPVTAVTSIKQGSTDTLYTQTPAYIMERNRIILDGVVGGGKGYEQNKISYVAGYVTFAQNADAEGDYYEDPIEFPDNLLHACLLLVGGMYNKRKNLAVKTFTLQGKSVTFRDREKFDEFEGIINHYRKPTRTSLVAI